MNFPTNFAQNYWLANLQYDGMQIFSQDFHRVKNKLKWKNKHKIEGHSTKLSCNADKFCSITCCRFCNHTALLISLYGVTLCVYLVLLSKRLLHPYCQVHNLHIAIKGIKLLNTIKYFTLNRIHHFQIQQMTTKSYKATVFNEAQDTPESSHNEFYCTLGSSAYLQQT